MGRNPYEVLGLDPSASLDEVRKAYRKLAQEHHPDHGGHAGRFEEFTDAYERICDGRVGDTETEPEPLGPYLTPNRVFWGGPPYEPITVTLCVRGDVEYVEEFGPDRLNGDFWEVSDIETIMTGEELCRMIFVPVVSDVTPRGTEHDHLDEITLHVNDEAVKLKVLLRLEEPARAAASPPRSAGGRSGEAGEARPTPPPMPSAAPGLAGLFLILAHAAPVAALVAQAGLQNPGAAAAIPIWIAGFGFGLTAWAIARWLMDSPSDWLETYLDTPIPYLIVGFVLWLTFGFALYS